MKWMGARAGLGLFVLSVSFSGQAAWADDDEDFLDGDETIAAEFIVLARSFRPSATLALTLENDVFPGTDRNYTNGIRLAFSYPGLFGSGEGRFSDRIAKTLLFKGADDLTVSEFAIGHSIFTPEDREATEPLANQHPYAGYVYGEYSVFVGRPASRSVDTLSLQVGWVGPSAGGKWLQNNFHRIVDAVEVQGWDNQLKDEPGIALSYYRKYRREIVGAGYNRGEFGVDILPNMGFTVGNVLTQINAGLTMRVGWGLDLTYGPPRVRPALGGVSVFDSPRKLCGFLFFGYEGRAVGRNIFLDGNSWKDSISVDRNTLVGDIQGGFVIKYDNWALTYTLVSRGEEFKGQHERQNFGSLSLVRRF